MFNGFCRRGSNVSLVLDMSVLGSVEPLNCGVPTPRERAAQEYLQSASRALSRQKLRDVTLNTQVLQAEFAVSDIITLHCGLLHKCKSVSECQVN